MRNRTGSTTTTRSGRALAFCALAGLLLAACVDDSTAPERAEPASRRVVAVLEITFHNIGGPNMRSSALIAGSLEELHRLRALRNDPDQGGELTVDSLTLPVNTTGPGNATIQLRSVVAQSFTATPLGGGPAQRHLIATYNVRNAQLDSVPFNTPRQNLTFVAVSTPNTITGTPVSTFKLSNGSAANPALALQLIPTGYADVDAFGTVTSSFPDVLQAFAENEITNVPRPGGITNVFPYGFMVRRTGSTTTRTLPASPSASQFDGTINFAYQIPVQSNPANNPTTISVMMLALDDSDVKLTQSLQEQNGSGTQGAENRAISLNATTLTLLPKGTAFVGTGIERALCQVRTAGPAGAPLATMFPAPNDVPWLIPRPQDPGKPYINRTDKLAVARCPVVLNGGPTSFIVDGKWSGLVTGTYTGIGTSLLHAPQQKHGGFYPGEKVEVVATKAIGGNKQLVGNYWVRVFGGVARFSASIDSLVAVDSATTIAAGDYDQDGDIDLVSGSEASQLQLITNDGTGPATPTTIPGPTDPHVIINADFDRDGDLDLAVASESANEVSILLNDGSANFSPGSVITLPGSNGRSMMAGDMNGDGAADLAILDSQPVVRIYLGNNTGSFAAGNVIALEAGVPGKRSMSLDDYDGDGDLDLAVVVATGNLWLLTNDAEANFTAAPTAVAGAGNLIGTFSADMNQDGPIDLVVLDATPAAVRVLRNNGDGTFTPGATASIPANPTALEGGDIDGDGDFDLLVAHTDGSITTLLNNAGATTLLATPRAVVAGDVTLDLALVDLDNDGDLDLAKPTLASGLLILFNQ